MDKLPEHILSKPWHSKDSTGTPTLGDTRRGSVAVESPAETRLRFRMNRPASIMRDGFSTESGATGYVRDDSLNRLLGRNYTVWSAGLLQHIRSVIRNSAARREGGDGSTQTPIIGDRSGRGASEWELFRLTGTNHPVAISRTAYIGIVGVGFLSCQRVLAAYPLARCCCCHTEAATVAAVASWNRLCSACRIFRSPTQRALIMLMVVAAGSSAVRVQVFPKPGTGSVDYNSAGSCSCSLSGFGSLSTAVAVTFYWGEPSTRRPRTLFSWCRINGSSAWD